LFEIKESKQISVEEQAGFILHTKSTDCEVSKLGKNNKKYIEGNKKNKKMIFFIFIFLF